MIEALESRCLLSATVEVTAKGAAAYEGGPSRFFYIRRSGDTSGAIAHLEHLILNAPESALLPQARRELDLVRGTVPP